MRSMLIMVRIEVLNDEGRAHQECLRRAGGDRLIFGQHASFCQPWQSCFVLFKIPSLNTANIVQYLFDMSLFSSFENFRDPLRSTRRSVNTIDSGINDFFIEPPELSGFVIREQLVVSVLPTVRARKKSPFGMSRMISRDLTKAMPGY